MRIFSIVFFSLVITMSCDRKLTYARWEIVNESKYSISITAYKDDQLSHVISLMEVGSVWQSQNYTDHPINSNFEPIDIALESDSLSVIFEDQKIAKYDFTESDRNPLYERSYLVIKASDTQYIHRYTFTNEDYESAEEIVD